MFVKKDLRKIPQILSDATSRAASAPPSTADETLKGQGIITELSFTRRAPEFLPACTVSLILQPQFRPAFDHLIRLSLYDCGLKSLAGIELSHCDDDSDASASGGDTAMDQEKPGAPLFPKLQQFDIGRNPQLTNDSLPSTFHTQFPSLQELWCDDCAFGPTLPMAFLQIHQLHVVRMTKNKMEGPLEEKIGLDYWKELRVLALDGNKLTQVGEGIGRLTYLEKLHLRQNELTSLPEGVPGRGNVNLTMVSLSSNKLSSFPASLVDVGSSLKEVYLNGNEIQDFPMGLGKKLMGIKKLNLAHNSIGGSDDHHLGEDGMVLPRDFVERFGRPDPVAGVCEKDGEFIVRFEGNPFTEAMKKKWQEEQKKKEDEERKAREMEMDVDEQ